MSVLLIVPLLLFCIGFLYVSGVEPSMKADFLSYFFGLDKAEKYITENIEKYGNDSVKQATYEGIREKQREKKKEEENRKIIRKREDILRTYGNPFRNFDWSKMEYPESYPEKCSEYWEILDRYQRFHAKRYGRRYDMNPHNTMKFFIENERERKSKERKEYSSCI